MCHVHEFDRSGSTHSDILAWEAEQKLDGSTWPPPPWSASGMKIRVHLDRFLKRLPRRLRLRLERK